MSARYTLLKTLLENLNRIENLVRLYEEHPKAKGSGRKPVEASDILRAAVVLLHAIFEQMCRTVEREILPSCGEEELNEVPLIGISKSGRPEKFFLGKLSLHRSKKVDDLIKESIEAHLAQSSYNTVEDFCAMLRRVGLDKKPFEPLFPNLSQLMERRHHIVHQCDKNMKRGTGHHPVRAIGRDQVRAWRDCVIGIYRALAAGITEKETEHSAPATATA